MITLTSGVTSVEFRNPDFGNTRTLSFRRIYRESQGNELNVFSDWPYQITESYSLRNLKTETADELRAFLKNTAGLTVQLTNHHSVTQDVIILNPEVQIVEDRPGRWTCTLEFEVVW